MINTIKTLLSIQDDSKDELLNTLIDMCEQEAASYCNIEYQYGYDSLRYITPSLTPAIVKMVVYQYNRLSTLGVSSHSYSGVSETFSSDYPNDIKGLLNKHRKITML